MNHGKKHIPALSEMHSGCFNLFMVALGACLHGAVEIPVLATNRFPPEPEAGQLCQGGFAQD